METSTPRKVVLCAVVLCLAMALMLGGMLSDENSVQIRLDKGALAFANARMAEAAQDFNNAVAADPHSAKAQLSLGVIYLFQYHNGVGQRADDVSGGRANATHAELVAKAEKRVGQIAE